MDKRILTNQDIEKYLDVQKNKLANLYNQAAVNTIMASMRNDIDAYISDHPDCMIEDLDHFIQLSDIYSYWVAHTTPTDVLKKIDHRKISKKSAWGVITISFFIVLIYVASTNIGDWIGYTPIDDVKLVEIDAPEVNP